MEMSLIKRIGRDMNEGVLVIGDHGMVMYVSPVAKKLLSNPNIQIGDRYISIFDGIPIEKNDEFQQVILDAIYDKTETHNKKIRFIDINGENKYFRIVSSFLFNDEGTKKVGVVLTISDITKEEFLQVKFTDTSRLFVLILSLISIWSFIYFALVFFKIEIEDFLITQMENVMSVICCFFIIKFTSLTYADIGMSFKGKKKYIIFDLIITMIIFAIMVVGKFIIGYEEPFFHFELMKIDTMFYPLTVVFQETLARSIVQESIYRVMEKKYASPMSIIVSSLFFGAMHMHKGLPYMVGAFLLMAVFGIIYDRQKCIWGTCIPHYVLGSSLWLLYGFD